jgi:hypothetical protein
MNIMNMEYPKALLKQCNNKYLLFEGLKVNKWCENVIFMGNVLVCLHIIL